MYRNINASMAGVCSRRTYPSKAEFGYSARESRGWDLASRDIIPTGTAATVWTLISMEFGIGCGR